MEFSITCTEDSECLGSDIAKYIHEQPQIRLNCDVQFKFIQRHWWWCFVFANYVFIIMNQNDIILPLDWVVVVSFLNLGARGGQSPDFTVFSHSQGGSDNS